MAFSRGYCRVCQGLGLIRIRYKSREPLDIAICDCRVGQWWRKAGQGYIRQQFPGLKPENRIAWLEDFPDDDSTPAEKRATLKAWAER